MKRKTDKKKLELWQNRLAVNQTAYQPEYDRMDEREELYRGTDRVKPVVEGDEKTFTPHVRNVCMELVEAQVSSSIPQPKVTARRKQDELKAKLIEDMIRNELDRMPFESMNDLRERTIPIQGGAGWHTEWDNTQRSHSTVGEVAVTTLHPKQILPQDGVYSDVEDMDYIILKVPSTKGYIKRQYGVDVSEETEKEPEIKGTDETAAADMVTMYVGYARNGKGFIDKFAWVNDTVVEDLEDYQARRLRRCRQCGAVEPLAADPIPEQTFDGTRPGVMGMDRPPELPEDLEGELPKHRPVRGQRKKCPYCGGTAWEERPEEYEEIYIPILRSDGTEIPGEHPVERASETVFDEMGLPVIEVEMEPTRIPLYRPNIYPVIIQKNVSVHGRFLGGSDLDSIRDQQNTINQLSAKVIDKLKCSGSYITLPEDASVEYSTKDMKMIRLRSQADISMIGVHNLEGNISQDLAYTEHVYEEARQVIGITDSFQGRKDTTATSGKAKEFSAAQSAGRLESKRVMKNAAYAKLFEAIFKFKLAYADEPRPVVSKDINGNSRYEEFNRYDFLEQDEAGEWYWNDQFLFSCDTTAPLASNREAMWQETRMNLESGAFGDPTATETLYLFWTKMEALHYPEAGHTKKFFEEKLAKEQQERQMAMQMQMQQMQLQQAQAQAQAQQPQAALEQAVVRQAQQDAARDAGQAQPSQAPTGAGMI